MIYFIQRASDQAIKIGTTIRLSQRLKALRAAFGDCAVVAIMDGSYADESALHDRFDSLLVQGREWFSNAQSLIDFINSEGRVWDGTDEQPSRSLASLKGTVELEEWVDGLVDHARQGTRVLLVRNALREFAESKGFREPMPK